jgi:superfamily I DNA and/or RNA helicase
VEKVTDTKTILTTYLRRLTNLSGNNRSLFLPRLSGDQYLDIHDLSQFQKEKSFSIIESLISRKKKNICALADARMEAVNEASKKLKKLQRLDHFIFEERGSRDLHVGWPFVRGKFADGTLVRCPLIFFPVELVIENNSWILKPRENAEITFNKSFLLAHAFYHQLKADEELMEENFEEADTDSTVFRTFIYQLLQKSNIDIHFNPDNYQDQLTSFVAYKKEEFDETHFNGKLKLFPEAVLGIFPQSGSYLIPDYVDLIKNEKIDDLETFFAQRSINGHEDSNFLQQVKEEKVFPAFPMDAWQENALKAVKLGHSLVVQGPPGTGKSQLICNLIADGLATGKKILVICQKRAALDVVFARMAENKMDDFIALVHDFKNDRKEIYQKAATQIDRIDDYRVKNNSVDSIQLERKFLQVSRGIDQISEELDDYKKTFFDDSECGYSPKELYLLSQSTQPVINIKQEYSFFTRSSLELFCTKLKKYADYAKRFKVKEYVLSDRKSFSGWSVQDWKDADEVLKEVTPYFEALQNDLEKKLSARPDWENCEEFWKNQSRATEMLQFLNDDEIYKYFRNLLPYSDRETSLLWMANRAKMVIDCFKDHGIEASIPTAELGRFQEALQKTMKRRRNIFGRIFWELFSKEKSIIKRTLITNDLKISKEGFLALEKKLDNRLNLEHNLSKLKKKAWLPELPKAYSVFEFHRWFDRHQKAIRAKMIFNFIRGMKNFIDPTHTSRSEFHSRMNILYEGLYLLHQKKEEWLKYLTLSQIERLTKDNSLVNVLSKTLRQDFDSLCELDKMDESFSEVEKNVIGHLHNHTGSWESEILCQLLINSVHMAWLDHLEVKYPILRIPTSGKMYSLERELMELIEEKEKISNEILLLRARERVVDELEFNRLNNRVTYRDLHHQLTKKKKIWPVRKVVSEFEEEIFKLLPCWLASPESASAIFPMREMFDLVIFDEASQCFAEQGIPSLFRARQVVVAGDSQQLRPSDLYMTRWNDEEQDHPDLEVDSLLNLGNRYLKSMTLQGHYRSQSIDLIGFSNYHFYKNQLKLLPDRHAFNTLDPVIEYIKVDGIWEDNTNQEEATRIAQLVFDLHTKYPKKEMGVVTFNAPQQVLVQDAIEEKFADKQVPIPSSLFVKNIENVQGDERDIILFSIGYAPDKNKKMNAQFGSLNLAGGENRLNVAVTRAREKIIVVTSIMPDALKVEETRNAGPKLLKAYLLYAWQISNKERATFPAIKNGVQIDSLHLKNIILKQLPEIAHTLFEDDSVPFSDLVVKAKNEYAALLLTDDKLYYHSLSAKAWHAQAPRLFESKNWKHSVSYSRNYWIDPERFTNEIKRLLI